MGEELKPCPLHGGKARLDQRGLDERMGYNTAYTISVDCCTLTMSGESKHGQNGWIDDPKLEGRAELITAWNTRPKGDVREALELFVSTGVMDEHTHRVTVDEWVLSKARAALSSDTEIGR